LIFCLGGVFVEVAALAAEAAPDAANAAARDESGNSIDRDAALRLGPRSAALYPSM
jgi:hypothetical protein